MGELIRAQSDGSLLLAAKAVPGSSRDRIVGPLGDALKVAVSAPPEGGRANKAICKFIAGKLGLPASAVSIETGGSTPFKKIRIEGISRRNACARLDLE
jgi:hypothetical protein